MELQLTKPAAVGLTPGKLGERTQVVSACIAIIAEEDGYSAIVLNLKGCGSCGDSEEEALEQAQDALKEMVRSYRDDGLDVPWRESVTESDIPADAALKWVLVNV